ncbi:MAG: neutral/alkaline non-lysosomal ceramidase N-terminal domain-containing protein, partial [Candidatus Poribacteria bacterium]
MKTQEQKSQSSLRVGIARADITPPVGIPMVGFAGRGPSIGVHDPLFATALVVTDGEKTAALIGCDLLDLSATVVAEARREINARLEIPPMNVTISCTHTHYGPDSYRSESVDDVAAYGANLIYRLAGIVQEAASNMQTARMGIGWGISDIGVNRREKRSDGQ